MQLDELLVFGGRLAIDALCFGVALGLNLVRFRLRLCGNARSIGLGPLLDHLLLRLGLCLRQDEFHLERQLLGPELVVDCLLNRFRKRHVADKNCLEHHVSPRDGLLDAFTDMVGLSSSKENVPIDPEKFPVSHVVNYPEDMARIGPVPDMAAGSPHADRVLEQAGEQVEPKWLGEVLARAGLRGFHRGLEGPIRGHHDDRAGGVQLLRRT
jgi:hypothetical protein